MKLDFLFRLGLRKNCCKFSSSCKSFSESSFTCTKKGGDYCGVYRELNSKLQAPSSQQPKRSGEVSFTINPSLYEPIASEAKDEE